MVKGVNKLIVEVSNPGGDYFEKAIFFVKPQMKDTPITALNKNADDLIAAAGRRKKSGGVRAWFAFAGAAGLGAAFAAVLIKLIG